MQFAHNESFLNLASIPIFKRAAVGFPQFPQELLLIPWPLSF
jgi:hypothetical protein